MAVFELMAVDLGLWWGRWCWWLVVVVIVVVLAS